MSSKIVNTYYDRYSRGLREERIHASRFLYWMYNTPLGHLATEAFLKRRGFSRLYGWFHRLRRSRKKIEAFARRMGIDLSQPPSGGERYKTFHDFFIREVDLSNRFVIPDPHVCISPVDGKVLVYSSINKNTLYRIKRSSFTLEGFLKDETLVKRFADGAMAVCRLGLDDYHHFHFPDSGRPAEAVPVQLFLHAGGPYSLRNLIPFYTENYRMRTFFESDHFSGMLIVEVGALTVGSIVQTYRPGDRVSRGERKGHFELGSTVVLLFQKGTIEFDPDLLANTGLEIETYVRFGDSLGRVPEKQKHLT